MGSFVKNNRLKPPEILRWRFKVLQTSGGQTETALGTAEPQEAPGAQINTPEQLLGHPPAKPAKQGWEPGEPRLEIGNSASCCYDHDSGEQQKKIPKKPHQMETVRLDTPPNKALGVQG